MRFIPLQQSPNPGVHRLMFRGDSIEITLETDVEVAKTAKAFLHCNIGFAHLKRKEIIAQVEQGASIIAEDWHDIPMQLIKPGVFSTRLALNEVGHFEAACCLIIPEQEAPIFVNGDPIHINVEPDDYCCSNSVYCAFPRQFGPNKEKKSSTQTHTDSFVIEMLDNQNYTVIPPSGTFRDLIKELDFITGKLRCQVIQLLPINPTPTTYARMGRFGSPYAALDFTAVDPALAEFDKTATPVDQFIELVDAVHFRGARLFLDIAINHTGWAAKIHEEHPEWLVRNADGSIHSPGAWGTVWEDLTELNHHKVELWQYLANVFLTWCQRGVDGFRCDAGYMIPYGAWLYIIARVRESYPDTVFLLEGLGGDPAVTLNLLNQAGMNWAYSELFQNYSRQAIEGYVSYAQKVSNEDGILIHYAETHDNLRLAANSTSWSKMRTALSALTSSNGAFAFTNGVEWFATEKIDVHSASALNWGAKNNQVDFIRRLNIIIGSHSAFHPESELRFIDSQTQDAVLFARVDKFNKNRLLCCVNINCQHPIMVTWHRSSIHFEGECFYDLISGKQITPAGSIGATISISLKPGEVICLADNVAALEAIESTDRMLMENKNAQIERVVIQTLSAVLLDLWCWHNGTNVLPFDYDIESEAKKLYEDVPTYLASLFPEDEMPKVIYWRFPADQARNVMVPPGHILVVSAPAPFRAAVCSKEDKIFRQYDAFPSESDIYFAIFTPFEPVASHTQRILRLYTTEKERSQRIDAPLLFLSNTHPFSLSFNNEQLRKSHRTVLATNGKGAMFRPCVAWGDLQDRYNALIAANLNPNFPEDRHIMFTRLRGKVIYEARTEELRLDLTNNFTLNKNGDPIWEFLIPVGKGRQMRLQLRITGVPGKNECRIHIRRMKPNDQNQGHDFTRSPVKLFLYPDIEDRNFHQETKAYAGPEANWPHLLTITEKERVFTFSPTLDRHLRISVTEGKFVLQSRWFYNIWHPTEVTRGLEACSDLWSPGYFEIDLQPQTEAVLTAEVITDRTLLDTTVACFDPIIPTDCNSEKYDPWSSAAQSNLCNTLYNAMKTFVVDRDEWKTVIAGYPWFLDWGRDTLICARGLIAGGFKKEVRAILLQFAKFAEKGTLPNIIHGSNVSNRDTSDAPLWLFTATKDYIKHTSDHTILDVKLQGELTLKDILLNIAQGYIDGTPNGIKVDHKTNLVYSPSHFTWMDTNYPAGTPRCGYPIEIQALWFAAQILLSEITHEEKWSRAATQTAQSVIKLFTLVNGSLSDCLNAENSTISAEDAVKTDHNRPNQLFAITLGLITDPLQSRAILRQTSKLLIPGAIRSLHDDTVNVPIPISFHGHMLNDPYRPYWGYYEGTEDTRRKPAYHNGTAWSWPFPSYAEALVMTYGKTAIPTAHALLSSVTLLLQDGCVGQVPEILDGNYPHKQRGCDAQAWGATEFYRVISMLK